MRQLIANFDIQLPAHLFVQRVEDDELRYKVQVDDFNVELFLRSRVFRTKQVNEKFYSSAIAKIHLSVAHDETLVPPSVAIKDNGEKDYTSNMLYFRERLPAYQAAAVKALNRLLLFFKYKLHNPLLREISCREPGFEDPKWTNESGGEIKELVQNFTTKAAPPGIHNTYFSVKRLTSLEDENLNIALQNPIKPKLYEEILLDAQAATFQNNWRRAILEMAVGCEIAIKQAFFKKSSAAGAVYDYLEDNRRINISIIELIHKPAKEAFGESFIDVDKNSYDDIDYLFRCRNKIAHKGKVVYRDNKKDI